MHEAPAITRFGEGLMYIVLPVQVERLFSWERPIIIVSIRSISGFATEIMEPNNHVDVAFSIVK